MLVQLYDRLLSKEDAKIPDLKPSATISMVKVTNQYWWSCGGLDRQNNRATVKCKTEESYNTTLTQLTI